MIITFENTYPFPLEAVLASVIKEDINKSGSFDIPTNNLQKMIKTAHHGKIPGEINLPSQFRAFTSNKPIKWSFNYEWDPLTSTKTWHVSTNQYENYIKWDGKTIYQELNLEGRVSTRQKAIMNLTLQLPFFQDAAEEKIIEKLIEQARNEYLKIISSLEVYFPITPEEKISYLNKFQYTVERGEKMNKPNNPWIAIWELLPFWFGTIMTSLASGYFTNQSQYSWITPIVFILLMFGLFVLAFTTVSQPRKNDFGFFLALFTSCYWLGTFLAP